MIRQGGIYLVDFGKKYHSELGKKRPAVVIQNDLLNRAVYERIYSSVIVIPLTTDNLETEYKIQLAPRDRLEKRSYIIATWVCSVDISRFDMDTGVLAVLNEQEFSELKKGFCAVL
jgi:mRNA interferase MazF